jgi:hypothetical protein
MKQKPSSGEQAKWGEIRTLAYHLWLAAECPAGRDLDFWFEAESQLAGSAPETGKKSRSVREDKVPKARAKLADSPKSGVKLNAKAPGNNRKNGQAGVGKKTSKGRPAGD